MEWFGVLGSLHRVLIRKQSFLIYSEVPEEMNILELSSSEGIERNTEKLIQWRIQQACILLIY